MKQSVTVFDNTIDLTYRMHDYVQTANLRLRESNEHCFPDTNEIAHQAELSLLNARPVDLLPHSVRDVSKISMDIGLTNLLGITRLTGTLNSCLVFAEVDQGRC